MLTSTLMHRVIIGFLSSYSEAFKNWRANALQSNCQIFQTSLFDVVIFVVPDLIAFAFYEQVMNFHLMAFGLVMTLGVIH